MTAGTTRFTAQEWSVIAGAPLLAALRRAMEILEHTATADERAEYRRFVLALADAAARGVSHRALLRRNRAETTADGRATPSNTRILDNEREAQDAPPDGTRRTN
jgi:hypothetical protein